MYVIYILYGHLIRLGKAILLKVIMAERCHENFSMYILRFILFSNVKALRSWLPFALYLYQE